MNNNKETMKEWQKSVGCFWRTVYGLVAEKLKEMEQ